MIVIRMSRSGSKKRPYYRLQVADSRAPRDGRYIERLGYFNPLAQKGESLCQVNLERVEHWLAIGAQPSQRVATLLKEYRQLEDPVAGMLVSEDVLKKRESKRRRLARIKAARAEAPAEAAAEKAEEAPAEEAAPPEAAAEKPEEAAAEKPEEAAAEKPEEAAAEQPEEALAEEAAPPEAAAEKAEEAAAEKPEEAAAESKGAAKAKEAEKAAE